jgi:AcrR family transcriptional regulator
MVVSLGFDRRDPRLPGRAIMFTLITYARMLSMSTLEKKPYHHGGLRQALILAAIGLLDAGDQDFSLREVARACEVSAAAAYRHFADKDALLAAVADHGFALLDQASDAGGGLPASQRLLTDLLDYVEFARQRPALYVVMFGRVHAEGAAMPNRSRSFEALRAKVFAVSPDAAEIDAARVWAAVHGCATLVIAGLIGEKRQAEGAVEAILAPLAHNPRVA